MANKKINQLVSKTAILSTDLFGIGDATTGQLFKKTIAELQAAIGGAVISVNGLVGTVVLDTDDIQELASPTNKYFTDARARGAISLTVTGNSGASTYSSGTGVLNVPTYTLAGLGGITASFLSGTSGISYNSGTGVISYSGTVYTDASIRALLSGGTGISYNSSTGAISYSGTVYTDSSVRALISLTTTGTSGASTYNNTTGVINVPEYTLAGLGGISLTSLSGGTGITYNNTTGAISYSGTVYTDASVRALFSASGSVSYNNTTGVISLTGGNLTEATSSVLTITGGSGAVIGGGTSIQVKQATTSVSGFLSSTDWTTFNNKQSTITLTTTGTSGAATFSSNTLNIPNYGSALSGYLPLTGGTLTGALGGTSATFSGQGQFNAVSNGIYLLLNAPTNGGTITMQAGGVSFADIGSELGNFGTGSATNLCVSARSGKDLILGGGALKTLTLASTGAATFSGNLTVDKSSPNISVNAPTGTTGQFNINNGVGSLMWAMYSTTGGSNSQGNWALYSAGKTGGAGAVIEVTPAGNVGISTTTPSYLLTVGSAGSTADSYIQIASTTTGTGNLFFGDTTGVTSDSYSGFIQYQHTGNNLVFGTSAAERMRITSGGNILMGTTTDNGERLYVSGAIRATGTITANSDLTLKKNLLRIENALEKVEQINGYTYEFKADDSKRHAGVIAQEIQTVLPEIVNKGNDGILGVEYGNISALLIEAIKEQQTQINELKALLNK